MQLILFTRSYADLETNLVSYSRLKSFGNIKTETDAEEFSSDKSDAKISNIDDCLESYIKFTDYCQFYGKYQALKSINLSIRQGEKVLVCGRTGCGKTTLTQSLFRLYDSKSFTGDIKLGGRSIFGTNLGDLRKQISMIAQVIVPPI